MADQKKSGIPMIRWISRILCCQRELENQERGLLFTRDNRRKANIGDYDHMFINILERGQNIHPELFTTRVFVGDSNLRRSPRD